MERREQISRAAFASIAEHGFEGLRMRDVADRAGVNIATVHYYYPSKERVIHAAYEELQARFQSTTPAEGKARDRLTAHLHGIRDLLIEDHELRGVLAEIALRARRDGELAAAVTRVEDAWFTEIRDLLEAGVGDGSWSVPVDLDATAALLIALCKGACLPVLVTERRAALRASFDQVLSWLTGAPAPVSRVR